MGVASDDAIASFAQDGVAIIRSAVRPEQLAALATDIASTHAAGEVTAEAGLDHFGQWRSVDSFRSVALESTVPEHAAGFLDSARIRLHHDRILRSPTDPQRRWGQDQPCATVDSASITAWVIVDNIPKDDSPEFWAGSHLGAWYVSADTVDVESVPQDQTVLPVPDELGEESSYDTRRWALEPGDVIFASSLTVYSIPASFTDYQAIAFNYVDVNAVFVDRPWPTKPPLSAFAVEPVAGEPLDDDQFPVAWPEA